MMVFVMPLLMHLVIFAACLFVYNMVVAPLFSRPAIHFVDGLLFIVFLNVMIALLKYFEVWERLVGFKFGA